MDAKPCPFCGVIPLKSYRETRNGNKIDRVFHHRSGATQAGYSCALSKMFFDLKKWNRRSK